MAVARFDVGAGRRLLAKLVLNLTAAAAGEVVKRAGQAIQAQISKVATSKLARHEASGHALSVNTTTLSGPLIQLKVPEYVTLSHNRRWFPFYNGMPPFVLKRANLILQAELTAALTGKRSPLLLADEAAEGEATKKSREQFKKETARIWRQSAEGKAARAAARKKAAR